MLGKLLMTSMEDVTVLPVSTLLAEEWPMLCSERVIWSSRKLSALCDEANGGFGRDVPTSMLWEEMYRRVRVTHVDVIPTLFRNNQLDVDQWVPLVDLIDRGGVHHQAFGDYALASVIVACKRQGRPPWEEPLEVQPYYAVGNTLRQHVAFRVVEKDVYPRLRRDSAESE